MKKKSITLLVGIIVCVLSCRFGTSVGEKIMTEVKYLNLTIASKERYSNDSVQLLKQFNQFITQKAQSFQNKNYFDSTKLSIDTILYSPDYLKIATFVIAKNPTSRQIAPNKEFKWYYDAYCYLGTRQTLVDTFDLNWLKNFYPINWYDEKEISSLIRDMYFTEFATIKDSTIENETFYVNLNDLRFWKSGIWHKYYPQ